MFETTPLRTAVSIKHERIEAGQRFLFFDSCASLQVDVNCMLILWVELRDFRTSGFPV